MVAAAGPYSGSSTLALVRFPSSFSLFLLFLWTISLSFSVCDLPSSLSAVSCKFFFLVFFLGFVRHFQQKISLQRAANIFFSGLLFGFVRYLSSTVDLCGKRRHILSGPHKPWSDGPKQAVFDAILCTYGALALLQKYTRAIGWLQAAHTEQACHSFPSNRFLSVALRMSMS